MPTEYVFLDFKGAIEGESTDEKHPKTVEIQGWSWGSSMGINYEASTAGHRAVGRPMHSDINFNKTMDQSTPSMLAHLWGGKNIPKAEMICYRTAEGARLKYLTMYLEDCVLANYSVGGAGGDLPSESWSLNYAKVKFEYTVQDEKSGSESGKKVAEADLYQNKSSGG